ncbi:hypothetical protein M9458_012737, partial [Cirrhinus mrigala]
MENITLPCYADTQTDVRDQNVLRYTANGDTNPGDGYEGRGRQRVSHHHWHPKERCWIIPLLRSKGKYQRRTTRLHAACQ